jgi:hypothetical protein
MSVTELASKLTPRVQGDTVVFDQKECEALGARLASSYQNASPFPHIVVDDFLPADLLRRVVAEFPKRHAPEFDDAHSQLKASYRLDDIASPFIHNLLLALNTAPLISFFEEMTGIKGLVPDPFFKGAGLHETSRGGHLSVHADFNFNKQLRLRRRINIIIFLNEGWQPEWGGELELWDKQMTQKEVGALPVLGRMVTFNTESDTYHGHPDPLTCPPEVMRRSIALYFYSANEEAVPEEERHSTMWKVRPASRDAAHVPTGREKIKALAQDFTPPILMRMLRGK